MWANVCMWGSKARDVCMYIIMYEKNVCIIGEKVGGVYSRPVVFSPTHILCCGIKCIIELNNLFIYTTWRPILLQCIQIPHVATRLCQV
jgi:hypothetical protein